MYLASKCKEMKTKSLLSRIIDEHAKEQSQTKYEYIYMYNI